MISAKEGVQEIETIEGVAFVFRGLNNIADFDKPSMGLILSKLGMTASQFKAIMAGTYVDWIGNPEEMSYPPEHPVEDLIIRKTNTDKGFPVEVTDVTVYEPHTMKTRLDAGENAVNFEATYVMSGEMTYAILGEYHDAGMLYSSNGEAEEVVLYPGDLLILPRRIARQITKVQPSTKYRYVSGPWIAGDMPVEIE